MLLEKPFQSYAALEKYIDNEYIKNSKIIVPIAKYVDNKKTHYILYEENLEIPIADQINEFSTKHNLEAVFYKNRKQDQTIRIFISGCAGSGKSYMAAKILDELCEIEPKDVILFARNDVDKALDKQRPSYNINDKGKKIKTNKMPIRPFNIALNPEDVLNTQLEHYSNCYLVTDDIEVMSSPAITEFCHTIQTLGLTCGRKLFLDCVNICHNPKNGQKTTYLRDESNYHIIFPLSAGLNKIKSYMKDYFQLSKKEINDITSMTGRSIVIRTEYPRFVIGLHKIMLL